MDSEAMLSVIARIQGQDLDEVLDDMTAISVEDLNKKLDKHLQQTGEPKRDRIAVESFIEWFDERERTNFDKETIEEHLRYLVREGYAKTTISRGRYYGLVNFAKMQLEPIHESLIREVSQTDVIKAEMKRQGREQNGRIGSGARPITEEEKEKMIQTAPTLRTELMVEILDSCGLRAEELSKLRMEKIDLENRELTVRTVKREDHERTISFDLNLKFKLEKYIQTERKKYGRDSDYLFVSNSSEHPMPHNTTRTIRELADDAGVQSYTEMQNGAQKAEITPHSFRKSYGIRMAEQAKSIKTIAESLGHSNTQSVSTYLDLS